MLLTNVNKYVIFVSKETKSGEFMTRTMLQKSLDALKNADIFSSVDEKQLKKLTESFTDMVSFKKGETVFGKEKKAVGVIVKGSAQVEKNGLILSRLKANDIFGTVTLYNETKDFVNNIVALTDCTVIFISPDGIDFLIESSPDFSKEYIRYLSKRIYFLNSRINSFGESSTKEKLLSFVRSNAVDGEFSLAAGVTTLSRALNISRASIYRAFEELEAEGKITKDGKAVKITEE